MRQRILWNHKWAFTKMADSAPVTLPGKWDFVNIPHTWNGIDGQDGGSDYYRGTCWYAKGLSRKDLPEADRYYLEFEGTAATAVLYVNGEKIAAHEGGYSTWRADITDFLKEECHCGRRGQFSQRFCLSSERGLYVLRRHVPERVDSGRVRIAF